MCALASMLGLGATSTVAAAVGAGRSPVSVVRCPLVVDVPDGWYVQSTIAEPGPPTGPTFTLYGDLDDRGRLRGPAFAVGIIGGLDLGFPTGTPAHGPAHSRPERVGRTESALWRTGDTAALSVPTGEEDVTTLYVARGLTDAQLVAVARGAVRTTEEARIRIPTAALPAGLHRITTAPIGPVDLFSYGAQRAITLVDDTGHLVGIDEYRADPSAVVLTRFWASTPPGGSAFTASRIRGSTVVTAHGYAPEATVRSVVDSARCEGSEGWERFRTRTSEVPAPSVLAVTPDDLVGATVVDGTDLGVRWAAAFSTMTGIDGTTGIGASVGGLAGREPMHDGSFTPFPATPRILTIATTQVEGRTVLGGVVPAGTATLEVVHPDGGPVAVTVLDSGPEPTLRWFVAVLPPFAGPPRVGYSTPATARDAAGNVVATCKDVTWCRP